LVYVDGACRGNPGHSGAGWVFCLTEGEAVGEGCLYLGHHTNNEAEYLAAALGLTAALELGVQDVLLRADSELMVRQIQGAYRVKNERLKPLYERLMGIIGQFRTFGIQHVLRERNRLADAMANRAIDSRPRL
jgi:ribonuclease HI